MLACEGCVRAMWSSVPLYGELLFISSNKFQRPALVIMAKEKHVGPAGTGRTIIRAAPSERTMAASPKVHDSSKRIPVRPNEKFRGLCSRLSECQEGPNGLGRPLLWVDLAGILRILKGQHGCTTVHCLRIARMQLFCGVSMMCFPWLTIRHNAVVDWSLLRNEAL